MVRPEDGSGWRINFVKIELTGDSSRIKRYFVYRRCIVYFQYLQAPESGSTHNNTFCNEHQQELLNS